MPVSKADLNGARREYHRLKMRRLTRKWRLEKTGSEEPMSNHERAKIAGKAGNAARWGNREGKTS
jgi:hypothetical protein